MVALGRDREGRPGKLSTAIDGVVGRRHAGEPRLVGGRQVDRHGMVDPAARGVIMSRRRRLVDRTSEAGSSPPLNDNFKLITTRPTLFSRQSIFNLRQTCQHYVADNLQALR